MAVTYDQTGNPLTYYDGSAFTWQNGRQLASWTKSGQTTSYTYNADGLRTKKVNPDGSWSEYHWIGSTLISENRFRANGERHWTLQFQYDQNGSPVGVSFRDCGESTFTYVYYYAKNLQGDIVGLYKRNPDGTGAQVIATYDYDPWGKVTAVRDANGNLVTYPSASNLIAFMNPLRYRGYYQDNDTGFYYLQSRYYDPELKRFINSDTHLLSGDKFVSFNLFAYCENDPQSRIDTGGNTSTSIPYQDIKIWLSDEDLALLIAELMEALGSYGWILFAFWFDEAPAVPKGSYELQKPLDITESKGKAAAKKIAKPNTAAGEVSSPPSPNGKGNRNKKGKKNQQPHNLRTNMTVDTVYNKNGVRIDYEYYGNGEGNVHIHVNGGKFRYDPMTNSLIPYKDAVLTAAVRKLLSNPEIMAAIRRGLRYITGY